MKSAILSTLLSVLTAFVVAQPDPINTNTIVVRDPAIWYNAALEKYFVFSTDNNIGFSLLQHLSGSALPDCSIIDLPGNCDLWAPDVNFIDGLYTMYYAVSTIGSQNSAIGVATSPSMEPGTWTDLGEVISSVTGDVYNAIDPNIIDDTVGLQLSFGSYWDGMFQVGLWPGVNDLASALPGTHLAGYSGRPAEGGFVYKPASQPYYYFFFSDGVTPIAGQASLPPAGTEYKVLVGRGADGQGPFYGELGNDITLDLTPPTGTLVLGSHDFVFAPGGQSIFADPVSGRDVIVYHYVNLNDDNSPVGPSFLGINYLDFSSGWPVVVD
ncbi:glycoside hydrolase family 43 protein [Gymnopus androsaceus JB14]|uniref:Endo-1,5-alpha-L-arabinanase A n=1 Tax=Gymnopus androsaceus JB14 TaxID=1447944 RepID=A0A6A4GY29_9AGAR|nr:glycoside hydrolase family 43 protein [Gymnopus androsaceus JB14]